MLETGNDVQLKIQQTCGIQFISSLLTAVYCLLCIPISASRVGIIHNVTTCVHTVIECKILYMV